MGSQLSMNASACVDRYSLNFLVVEGKSPLRLDLIAVLRQQFPIASFDYLHASDNANLTQVVWHNYDLVLCGCAEKKVFIEQAVAADSGVGATRDAPLVVLLKSDEVLPVYDLSGNDGQFMDPVLCFPADIPAADFLCGLAALFEVRSLCRRYPLSLPGWRMKEVLHNSENAVIFLAENQQGNVVAIKRFKFDASDISERALTGFFRDARMLMSHQNNAVLVSLLDAGVTAEGAVYLVMEYLPGMTLKERLMSAFGAGNLELRLDWFRNITTALALIHESGLLHRDLKSSNILMREDDSPALLDLGIETHLLVESGFLREDEIYGTPFYISPERIVGEPATVQADMYALGILFYEILTGEKPVQGRDLGEILQGHMFDPLPQLPVEFAVYQPLLSKLLLKSPESRLNSAHAALSLLDELSG